MARAYDHTGVVCLDVKVSPKTPRTKSKAVSKGNGPIPQDKYGFGGLTMKKMYRVLAEEHGSYFDRKTNHFNQRFEHEETEQKQSASSRTVASGSAVTSRRGGRCKPRHEDSRV